jgi:pimeloyl-ACP methyl ester carboxylesterase
MTSHASAHLRRLYVDGRFGQIHAHVARPADAPSHRPLVLFHQNPSTAEEYRHLLLAMATDRIVVAFDTPGYGMSDSPPAPLSIDGYAAALVEAIDALGLAADGAIDVAGYHTGAFLAIEAAHGLGPRCARIALCGIPLRDADECARRLAEARAVAAPTEDGAAILARLHWLWGYIVGERVSGIPIERAARMFMERARPLHRYAWAYEAVWRYPAAARLARIAQPVLVVITDEPLAEPSRQAAALIGDAHVVDMPGLTRDIFEPEGGCAAFAAVLRAFLD